MKSRTARRGAGRRSRRCWSRSSARSARTCDTVLIYINLIIVLIYNKFHICILTGGVAAEPALPLPAGRKFIIFYNNFIIIIYISVYQSVGSQRRPLGPCLQTLIQFIIFLLYFDWWSGRPPLSVLNLLINTAPSLCPVAAVPPGTGPALSGPRPSQPARAEFCKDDTPMLRRSSSAIQLLCAVLICT